MNITILPEPNLEFAGGSHHIDPRHGISYYSSADGGTTGPATIRVGIVGTREAIHGVKSWLDHCRGPIAAKQSRLTHLYLPIRVRHQRRLPLHDRLVTTELLVERRFDNVRPTRSSLV